MSNLFENSMLLDDKQLWYVAEGPLAFPVICTPAEYPLGSDRRRVIVEPAFPTKAQELAFLRKHLNPLRVGPEEPNVWILEEHAQAKVMATAPGITPSYYYRGWETAPTVVAEPPPEPEPDEEIGTEAVQFLTYFHRHTGIIPLDDLKLLWLLLSDAIFDWVFRRRKAVDFGPFRLVAVPYRKDWAECLLAQNPKIRTLFNQPATKRKALLLQSDWYAHLRHPLISAINRHDNTCCWTLEAIPTESWTESVNASERKTKGAVGLAWYGQHWLQDIEDHEDIIFQAFESFLDQTNLPHGSVAQSSRGLAPVLVPHRPSSNRPSSHPVLRLADHQSFDPAMEPLYELAAKTSELQALPPIPFGAKDLRDTGPNLLPPANEPP